LAILLTCHKAAISAQASASLAPGIEVSLSK
jgi:hypothetical protein